MTELSHLGGRAMIHCESVRMVRHSIGVSTESHAISTPVGLPPRPLIGEAFASKFAARPVPTVEVRPAHQPRPVHETLDAGQCRIWLNELRREIDRLRMGLDVRPEKVVVDPYATSHRLESVGFDARCGEMRESLSEPPTQPKLYSVEPLAAMPDRRHPDPIEQPSRIHVLNHYHVTNLGTLLDVLA